MITPSHPYASSSVWFRSTVFSLGSDHRRREKSRLSRRKTTCRDLSDKSVKGGGGGNAAFRCLNARRLFMSWQVTEVIADRNPAWNSWRAPGGDCDGWVDNGRGRRWTHRRDRGAADVKQGKRVQVSSSFTPLEEGGKLTSHLAAGPSLPTCSEEPASTQRGRRIEC